MKEGASSEMRIYRIFIVLFSIVVLIPEYGGAYDNAIRESCVMMAEKIVKSGKKNIVVADFTDLRGNVRECGRWVAERFSVTLAKVGEDQGFAVIDRHHINNLLREHKLGGTGLIDPETVKKLGKISGADAIIVGTLTPFRDTIEMTIKALDMETAKILGSGTGKLPLTEALRDLCRDTLTSGPGPETAKVQQRQVAYGFTFDLMRCKRSGSSVRCEFQITSDERDERLVLYGSGYSASVSSRLFDDMGNEYSATRAQLGGRKPESTADSLLLRGVRTNAEIQFEGISSQAKMIRLLEVRIVTSDHHSVQFRNVAFSE